MVHAVSKWCILSVNHDCQQIMHVISKWYLLSANEHTSNLYILDEGNNVYLLLFYILTTSKVISGRVPTCDIAHSWRLYSAVSLEHQAPGTLTCSPTQLHYPDTEPTNQFLR